MSIYTPSEAPTAGPLGDAHLDEKSQWIADLLKSGKVRRLSEEWGVRHEVWQRFWDRLFEEPEYAKPRWRKGAAVEHPYRPPKGTARYLNPEYLKWALREGYTKNAPPVLLEFDGSYWERHQETKRIGRAVGLESYAQALKDLDKSSPIHREIEALQRICAQKLMGVDVYWDGPVEDTPDTKDASGVWFRKMKPNTSKSNWGTLKVYFFPFTAVFRYDDCEEYVVLSALPLVNNIRRFPKEGLEQLQRFVRANLNPDVLETRDLRLKLRSMDDQEISLNVVYGHNVEVRGVFHIEGWGEADVWSNPRTREVVDLSPGFQWHITTDKRAPSQGFKCVNFLCGEPELHVHPDNFVKQADKLENLDDQGPQQLSRDALGIRLDYFDGNDDIVRQLVRADGNVDPVLVDYVRKLYQAYRDDRWDDNQFKTLTLSNAFFLEVYMNDRISRAELNEALQRNEDEGSLLLEDLVRGTSKRTHSHLLQDLYHRLAYLDGSLRACCWYTFWHAVALNNRGMKYRMIPRGIAKQLDPAEPGSPLAKVLSRAELKQLLVKASLYVEGDPEGSVIDDALMDRLYEKLDEVEGQTMRDFSEKWKRNVEETKVVIGQSARSLASARARAASVLQEREEAEADARPAPSRSSNPLANEHGSLPEQPAKGQTALTGLPAAAAPAADGVGVGGDGERGEQPGISPGSHRMCREVCAVM